MMRRHQAGEIMLAMMIVVLVVVGLSGGHMGMMGHGNHEPENSTSPNDQQGTTSNHRR